MTATMAPAQLSTTVVDVHGALSLHKVQEPDQTALLHALSAISGSRDHRRFPGSNPCSLERADFPKLKAQPYWVCEKTNGLRFLLCCCTHKSLKVCMLVDRAMQCFLLPLQAVPTAMFQGSVIDCELAFNKVEKQWQLLAFDAYVVSGVPMFHRQFSQRMAALSRAMKVYEYTLGDPVPLKVKSFLPTSMFHAYDDHESNATMYFDIDGLILTPELSHAAIGRHTELFKLKTKHTVDYLVGGNGITLCVYDPASKSHVHVADLRAATTPGTIVECLLSGTDGLWDVVCVRHDKKTANDRLTYERTLVNMDEQISLHELKLVFQQH